MSHHKLYTNKYKSQVTQFSNPAAMVVALCEKAISSISVARIGKERDDNIIWCQNLGIVKEIIVLILATLDSSTENKEIVEVQKFYSQLSLYTSALIAGKIDFAKSHDLLEAFRITRDTWKDVERKYVALAGDKHGDSTDNIL